MFEKYDIIKSTLTVITYLENKRGTWRITEEEKIRKLENKAIT